MCGVDDYSGKSSEHRRDWVEFRLLELGAVTTGDMPVFGGAFRYSRMPVLTIVLPIEAKVSACNSYNKIEASLRHSYQKKEGETPRILLSTQCWGYPESSLTPASHRKGLKNASTQHICLLR